MSAKPDALLRQQYLIPKGAVKKLREMSREEGVSTGELARRAIDALTSGRVVDASEEERAAGELLAEIHATVRAQLRRIDASLAELRERERALAGAEFRERVRAETLAWLAANPDRADAIVELLAPEAA